MFPLTQALKGALAASFVGDPLLPDAINLLCAGRLICLLSEPAYCSVEVAIVFGRGLK